MASRRSRDRNARRRCGRASGRRCCGGGRRRRRSPPHSRGRVVATGPGARGSRSGRCEGRAGPGGDRDGGGDGVGEGNVRAQGGGPEPPCARGAAGARRRRLASVKYSRRRRRLASAPLASQHARAPALACPLPYAGTALACRGSRRRGTGVCRAFGAGYALARNRGEGRWWRCGGGAAGNTRPGGSVRPCLVRAGDGGCAGAGRAGKSLVR